MEDIIYRPYFLYIIKKINYQPIQRQMPKPYNNLSHLTIKQVKQIINETFFKESFRKHMQNVMNQNVEKNIPPQSVKYVNKIMQKIVNGSSLRASELSTEREEACFSPGSDIIKVKIVNKHVLRNSSIDWGNFDNKKYRHSQRFYTDSVVQDKQIMDLHYPLTKRSQPSNINNFADGRRLSKMLKHKRTSTESNCFQDRSSFQVRKMQQVLLPIFPTQQSTERSNPTKSHLNQQLDQHIESLRSRKLKLQAAFNNFNNTNNENGYSAKKQKENSHTEKNNKNAIKSKRQESINLKSIVTDYDGEIIAPAPIQRLRKKNLMNKENNFVSGSFAPTVRIKTQISSNFFQLQQNEASFKPSKSNTRRKFVQSAMLSSIQYSYTSESTSKKASICSVQQDEVKVNDSLGHKNKFAKDKMATNGIFTAHTLARSKRMIEKEMKSQKRLPNVED